MKCLKTFFAWAGRIYHLPNPCSGLSPLPRSRQLPRVLTTEEVRRLLESSLSARDRTLLLTVMDCGLRVGEVAGLRRYSLQDGWLVVTGKSGVRQVPVSTELAGRLDELGDGEYLWMGRRGPLGKHGVIQAYNRMFEKAGILGRKGGAHALRHTFATMYLRSGGGVRQLQSILGHQSVETTMIYVHLAGVDVRIDHARHSPVKTLGLLDGGIGGGASRGVGSTCIGPG